LLTLPLCNHYTCIRRMCACAYV